MTEDPPVQHGGTDAERRRGPRASSGDAAAEGATAVEYAIMLAAIAAVIVIVVAFLGLQSKSQFCDTTQRFQQTGRMSPTGVSNPC